MAEFTLGSLSQPVRFVLVLVSYVLCSSQSDTTIKSLHFLQTALQYKQQNTGLITCHLLLTCYLQWLIQPSL